MIPSNVLVAVDFETAVIEGDKLTASTEFYLPNFRVTSCAFAWKVGVGYQHVYVTGEDRVRAVLSQLAVAQNPLIAHNLQFEYGVAMCRFPDLQLNWSADSMRMSQLWDNGGQRWVDAPLSLDELYEMAEQEEQNERDRVIRNPEHGLSLSACVRRILGPEHDHKAVAYEVLRSLGVPAGREKTNLHMLPPAAMEAYNVGDAIASLRLYYFISNEFKREKYDWSLDWSLFKFMMDRMVRSRIVGIRVDLAKVDASIATVTAEIEAIKRSFKELMAVPIKEVEKARLARRLSKYKTDLGREKYLNSGKHIEECAFNPASTTQLTDLFVRVLGMTPQFKTEKGAPSFASSHLPQWGEGGKILGALKKRGIVLTQLTSLRTLASRDGRWHVDIKVCGTSTGRMAGGTHE